MLKAILAAALCVSVLAGSASGGNPDPRQMVLRLQDMPTGFGTASASGYKTIAAVAKGSSTASLAQYKAWGYATGYEADFSADGASIGDILSGASDIDSSASVYSSSSGAEKSLNASVAACNKAPFKELSVGAKIGDEAHLCAVTKKSGDVTVEVYVVLWRHGRFKGSVEIAGVAAGTSATQAVKLAAIQDKRMG
jgi:hypothetical protein